MTTSWQPPKNWRPHSLLLLWLVLVYSLSAWLCIELARHPGSIAAIWYPNAVALCFLAATPRRQHPALLLLIASNNIVINLVTGTELAMALGFAFGNTTEVWLAHRLLHRLGGVKRLMAQPLQLFSYLLQLILIVSGIGAVIGTVVLGLAGMSPLAQVLQLWWISDAIGMATVVPLGVIAIHAGREHWRSWRTLGASLLFAIYGSVVVTGCFIWLPYPYVYVAALLVAVGFYAGVNAVPIASAAASVTMTLLISESVLQPTEGMEPVLFYLPMLLTLVLPVLLAVYVSRSQLDNARLARLTTLHKEQAAQLRAVLAAVPDGILSVTLDGIIKSGNAAAAQLFGYPAMALVGMPLTRLLPAEMQPDQATDLQNWVGLRQERIGLHAGGDVLVLDVATESSVHNDNAWFVLTLRDISEAKKVARMKSQFVATVSHELRTPLTAITGAIEVLVNGGFGELSPPVKELLDLARRNGQRLRTLVNDLLDMERLNAGKLNVQLEPVDLRDLLATVHAINAPLGLQKHIAMLLRTGEIPLVVRVDSARLQQVLTNLITNAIKFSPAESEILISARVEAHEVEIVVRDYGPGVPDVFKDKLFEAFAQADGNDNRQHAGTGLGLAISKALVEQMRGRIGHRTPVGVGAEFFIRLPLYEATVEAERAG